MLGLMATSGMAAKFQGNENENKEPNVKRSIRSIYQSRILCSYMQTRTHCGGHIINVSLYK